MWINYLCFLFGGLLIGVGLSILALYYTYKRFQKDPLLFKKMAEKYGKKKNPKN